MPIYEYFCDSCNHEFELLQKISEAGNAACPTCSGQVERKLSQASFHLKGSGWFTDGYNGKSGGNSPTPASTPTGSSEGSSKKAAGHGCGTGACCAN
ncbi:MAG: zinc ribbon domain-containing protein [Deltaproteobacteria bacterium]|nr:zinc ribbon domain-containing protein [Deltaproteobacteria bacterium]